MLKAVRIQLREMNFEAKRFQQSANELEESCCLTGMIVKFSGRC